MNLLRPNLPFSRAAIRSLGVCLFFAAVFCPLAPAGTLVTYDITTTGDPSYPITGTMIYDTTTTTLTSLTFDIDGSTSDFLNESVYAKDTFNGVPWVQVGLVGGGPTCIGGQTGDAAIYALFTACTGGANSPAVIAQSGTLCYGTLCALAANSISFSVGTGCFFGACSQSATLNLLCGVQLVDDCPSLPAADQGLIIGTFSSSEAPSAPSTPEPASGICAASALLGLAVAARKRGAPGEDLRPQRRFPEPQ